MNKYSGKRAANSVLPLAILCLALQSAWAQTVPEAGVLRQQFERDKLPAQPQVEAPRLNLETPELSAPTGTATLVREFRFTGNQRIASDVLARALVHYLDKQLDFSQLQLAAAAVAQVYRDAGWVVNVSLPKQDVTDGVVTFRVVEAIFAGVKIEGPVASRVRPEEVVARIEAQQKVGAPLNADAVDRALLIAGDLPGISVTGDLREGAREGETELVLMVSNQPLLSGEIGLDNTGARSTGENRVTLSSNLNSPLGLGDQFSLNVIHTDGSDYSQLSYSLPVDNYGTRASVNLSELYYRLIGSDFAALNGSGNSTSAGIDLSYPLLRARQENLSANFGLQNKTFHNDAAGVVQSDYSDMVWNIGLNSNWFDDVAGGGTNSMELTWYSGYLNQGILDVAENPYFNGTFDKLHYTLARQQSVTDTVSFSATLAGQVASHDLDTSERLYLGGATGVRAYPANEGGGSTGQLLNLELRQRLPFNLMLSGFYDWGYLANSANIGPSYELKGYGAAVNWTADSGATVKLTYAHRDGDNPNPTSHGMDQDGSLVKDRWWLTLTVPFGYNPQVPVAVAATAPAPALVVEPPVSAHTNTTVAELAPVLPVQAQAAAPAAVAEAPAVASAPAAQPVQQDDAQMQIAAIQQTLSAWVQAWQRADVDS